MPQNSAKCFNHIFNTKNLVLLVLCSKKCGIKGATPQNAVIFPYLPSFPPHITHIKYNHVSYCLCCFLISHEAAKPHS